MLPFRTFDKCGWLLVLLPIIVQYCCLGFQFICLSRTIPIEGSRDAAVGFLWVSHFSGSVKKIGFRWALLCNSLVLYVVSPMQIQACRLHKCQITRVRFGFLLKMCNRSWVAQTRSESCSFKRKQICFSNLKYGFIVIKQMFSLYS